MKRLLLLVLFIAGMLLAGCNGAQPNPDPHRGEDITGDDNTEGWW